MTKLSADHSLGQTVGRAVSWKAVQHGGVKAIYMVRLLILARILSPDDFGLLAIAYVAIDVLLRVTEVGMIPALVQRDDIEEAHYDVAWTVDLTRAMFIAFVVFITAPLVAAFMGDTRAIPLIQVLALRPLIQALTSIKVAQLTRELRFKGLALIYLPEALVTTIVSIALARPLGVWALVVGGLAGPVTQTVMSYIVAPHRPRLRWANAAAAALIRFGRWIFAISLLSIIGTSILRAVIARQLGATELGLYYLAASLAFLPTEVASEIVGPVAFPLYARLQSNPQQASRAFRSFFTSLAALLVPGCALLIVLAPAIVTLILDERWQGTTPIIQVLTLVNIVGLLGESIVPILNGRGQPQKVALIEFVQSSGLIIGAWLLTGVWGVVGAAAAWLPATLATQPISIAFAYRTLPRPLAGLFRPLLVIVLVALLASSGSYLLIQAVSGPGGLILALLLGGALWFGLLWLAERWFYLGLTESLLAISPRIGNLVGLRPVPQELSPVSGPKGEI